MTERDAHRILNLQEGCSLDDIRLAYMDLSRVWQPEHFDADPRLRAKAETTLLEIGLAFELLQSAAVRSHTVDSVPQPQTDIERRRSESDRPSPRSAPVGQMLPASVTAAACVVTIAALAVFLFIRSSSGEHVGRKANSLAQNNQDVPQGPPSRDAYLVPLAPGSRPESGTELLASRLTGHNAVEVTNSTPGDAVMVLALQGIQQRGVYIRTGETATVTNVAPGTYAILVMLGVGWTGDQFANRTEHCEFNRPADLAEQDLGHSTEHTRLNLTLSPVPGGTADTHHIPAFRLGDRLRPWLPVAPEANPLQDEPDPIPVGGDELRRTGTPEPLVPTVALGTR